jgi:hypothetical protein
MALRPLDKSTLPFFTITVGVDFGKGSKTGGTQVVIGLTCPQRDCGKTFFVKDLSQLGDTAPCPHCMKTARTDGDPE